MNLKPNVKSYHEAINLINNNIFAAKIALENLLKKEPDNCRARVFHANVLARIGSFEEAQEEYNKIIELKNNNAFLGDGFATCPTFFQMMLCTKLKILVYYEKYQEILDLINQEGYILDDDQDVWDFVYYCKIKLGIPIGEGFNTGYRFSQAYEYSEKRFRNHIKRHIDDGGEEEKSTLIFNRDFPLDQILKEIKKYIPSRNCLYPGNVENSYCFRYDNCGLADGCDTNYFKVICFHNSPDIITMYPSIKQDAEPFVNLNYLKNNENQESQIDKFNRRFRRN